MHSKKLNRFFLIGLAILFSVMTYLSFYFWWQENEQSFDKNVQVATSQGLNFGKTATQLACFEKVIEDSKECREMACSAELRHFLSSCFSTAKTSPKFCQETPDANDYFGKVSWAVSACRKRKVKNGNCPNVIDQTSLLCRQYAE